MFKKNTPEHSKSVLKERRFFLKSAAAFLFSVTPIAKTAAAVASNGATAANAAIVAVRVWPAEDYTRVTLEHDTPLKFTHFTLDSPERLVVDIEGVRFNSLLKSLPEKISVSDPYIQKLRAGQFTPNVVRLVIELKAPVVPQIFTLEPFGKYQHRLVLDLYPKTDPLLALLGDDFAETKSAEKSTVNDKKFSKNPKKSDEKRTITVVLDPGHGGEDPGAIGRAGTYEKKITLQIARALKKEIDAQKNMRAVLTRDADFFVGLGKRVEKARRINADLFVSIHADAWKKPNVRGSSVFVLSEKGASSTMANILAQNENASDLMGGINKSGGIQDKFLARTLLDLSQTATQNHSLKLGKYLLTEIKNVNTLHRKSVERAGFAVLKAPDIPSVLVETAFISNPLEEKRLKTSAFQKQIAKALLKGIEKYFKNNPPGPKTSLAQLLNDR